MVLRNVAAVVGDTVAAFELGVLSEVFGLDRSADGLPGYDFAVCGLYPGLVRTTSGYAIQVDHGLDRLTAADLIAVPSWSTQDVRPPEELVSALHKAVGRGARILAVCSGAFLLAAAGLLDGRRAATHWRYAPLLADRFPKVHVDPAVLYVEEGPVVTSAGTAAAIDAALHLVRQEHGAAVAGALARRMVTPGHRAGGQAQYLDVPVPAGNGQDLAELLQWVRANLHEQLPVRQLADRALLSPRTFARRFHAATGTTPHRWLLEQRLMLAEKLLEETDLSVDHVAQRCGMGSADTLRHHFNQRRRVSPTTYRRTFRGATVGSPALSSA